MRRGRLRSLVTEIGDTRVEALDIVGDAEDGYDGVEGGGDELAVGRGRRILLLLHVQHRRHPRHLPRGCFHHLRPTDALPSSVLAAARHLALPQFFSFLASLLLVPGKEVTEGSRTIAFCMASSVVSG